MLRESAQGMEEWMVALFIFGAVAVAMMAAAWSQLLEHHRRKQAMEVIKAAIEKGVEPPAVIYEQIASAGQPKPPWSEVVVFTSLALGFWIAYAQAAPDDKTPFLVVAATMSATALGCLALAVIRPGRGRNDSR